MPVEQQRNAALGQLLARDGWTLRDNIARHNSRRLEFFFAGKATPAITAALRRIQRADRNRFQTIGVVVAPTTALLQEFRSCANANKFPRALFASAEEIYDVANGKIPVKPEQTGGIASFQARILDNAAVGGAQISHYRLAFQAPKLQDAMPPQFFMMDSTPAGSQLGERMVRRGAWRDAVDLAPQPLLKRPFGICRDFHPHLPGDYVKRLRLPPAVAVALYPVLPDHFDMLYKVLPHGVGTPLIAKLKRGQTVNMLGPLGRPFDVRRLRVEGVAEVHVIGGGVGMAPLILLVESLRYYGFRVKAFLGIATLQSLRYRDELAATFGEEPRDAYIYIDDLLAAGVPAEDIYVSCDSGKPARIGRGIPKENLFAGFVTDLYRRYLKQNPPHLNPLPRTTGERRFPSPLPFKGEGQGEGSVSLRAAFTCGPNRMMELVAEIAAAAGIPLRVLLEKRMGCGMGVCFSCVCQVRRADGTDDYARVCTDGPLFEARDILWKNDDSKQPSAPCGCAPRC